MPKTLYLAGPDVFLPNASKVLGEKKARLEALGFDVWTPLDTETDKAHIICGWNKRMIASCDIVLADVQPFRGTEPDSGTVFEIGYAIARGKTVYTYNNPNTTYTERCDAWEQHFGSQFLPERFGLKQNLMISCCVAEECATFDDVLNHLKENYQ